MNYKKLFFSVEDHAAYQSDNPLTEEEIGQAKDLGFSKWRSASWFTQTLRNRFQNDMIRMLREYPQRPEHAFMSSEGRWIDITPPVLSFTFISNLKVFQRREPIDEYVIGVDTSGGIGQDASAIAVISKRSGSLAACWVDHSATVDELADQVRIAYQMYGGNVVVESNGIGLATVQACRARSIPVTELKTSKASQYQGLLAVKRKVEEGVLSGPEELSLECDSLHVNKYDKFDGKKDLCMAAGFCYLFLEKNPASTIPEPERGPNVFSISSYYGKKRAGNWSEF